jgi:hypothetical protein
MARGKPKCPVKTSRMPPGLKRYWSRYNARLRAGKRSTTTRRKAKVARRRRARGRRYRPSRRGLGSGLNYVLGAAGSYVGEVLETEMIRPRVEKMTGARTKMNVGLEGGLDVGIGFAANMLANRMPGGRSFVKGLAYTIGGKGIGKLVHALTGKTKWFGG